MLKKLYKEPRSENKQQGSYFSKTVMYINKFLRQSLLRYIGNIQFFFSTCTMNISVCSSKLVRWIFQQNPWISSFLFNFGKVFRWIFTICRILKEHQFLLLIIFLTVSQFFSQNQNTFLRSHDTYSFGNQCLDYYFWLNDTHREKLCFFLNSVQEWLLGCFWPFSCV